MVRYAAPVVLEAMYPGMRNVEYDFCTAHRHLHAWHLAVNEHLHPRF